MSDAPEIKVKLTAEDAGVSAAIKELTSQLKTLKKQQDETATSGLSLAKAFQGIAVGAAAIGLARIGKDAFDSAIEIGKMADKTGISTQALSVFHHVAEELGTSTESVDKALIKAAKSITEFEAGGTKAAQGFKILGLTAKDFAGLNSDQTIALVTTRLGGMSAGFAKATAAQVIFSKAGAEFIPVANAIAGEGFDKITKSVSRLGLLLTHDQTDAARVAKASLQELSDAGKGMATQFEAGMLPAITDVGDALLNALGDDGAGSSFKKLGETAGTVIKDIAFGFLSFGASAGHAAAEIEEVFDFAFNHTKEFAKTTFAAIGGYIRGGAGGAAISVATQLATTGDKATQEFAARLKAIDDDASKQQQKIYDALFPSDDETKRRAKERADRLRPEKQIDAPAVTAAVAPTDAAAKAALSLLEKQLQDELTIHRAYAKQTDQVDKEMFEKGEISLADYFDRRKVAVTADAEEEIAILQRGVAAANAEAQKAAVAKKSAATPKDADKQEAARLQALTKVEELETKISEITINASTKVHELETEQFAKREENQQKILEFHRLVDTTQGKTLAAAKEQIQVEAQKMAIILAQAGESKAQIDAELAKYTLLKTAEATFTEQEKAGKTGLTVLDAQRAAIEDKVKNGKLFQVQADQQILDLYREELPALQSIATQLTANAKTEEEVAQAAEFQKKVNEYKTASNVAGQGIAQLKQSLQGGLQGGFSTLFSSLVAGTTSVGNSFKNFAGSVIESLGKVAAQMLATLAIKKLFGAIGGGASGGGGGGGLGGILGSLFGAAEGGLVKGPGGPKSDSIPARLSHGEYIVKADAVSSFGVNNLEAINRGLKIPSLERLALPKYSEGGLVGNSGGAGESSINLGIGLDEGLILLHLSSKAAGNIIIQHLVNNPKAAGKALSRST